MNEGDNEYVKPRKFRDRSKTRRGEQSDHDHPVHRPYAREHKNWTRENVTVDGLGEDFDE